jgi:4-aminobutyrate aminotransferase/(S)-3-amino-2-methylpropionate transaminase
MTEPDTGAAPPAMIAALPAEKSGALVEALALSECPALTARRARREEQTGVPNDPIVWTRALGANVWDADGNRYVDLSAGFGAAAVGHNHPQVVAAIAAQSGKLVHALGDMHPSDVKIALLQKLAALAPMPDARVMLGLSGSDAITAALKTAVLTTGKSGVLAFAGAYHGLDYAPLAACGYSEAFRAPFAAQLNPHVMFAPYPGSESELVASLDAVESALKTAHEPIGAVLVEPMLGRGGVVVPPSGFMSALSALCVKHGALLVLDAIMAGLGRNGVAPFGVERSVRVDLICIGKALGGGLPVSACLGSDEAMRAWGKAAASTGGVPMHTGTFFGNPLGCASALAALEVIEHDSLAGRAAHVGTELLRMLHMRLGPHVSDVRGMGFLIGIDTGSVERGLTAGRRLLEAGYITVPAGDGSVISLTPPLTIDAALLDGFVTACERILSESAA